MTDSIILEDRNEPPPRWSLTVAAVVGVAIGLLYGVGSGVFDPAPFAIAVADAVGDGVYGMIVVLAGALGRNFVTGAV